MSRNIIGDVWFLDTRKKGTGLATRKNSFCFPLGFPPPGSLPWLLCLEPPTSQSASQWAAFLHSEFFSLLRLSSHGVLRGGLDVSESPHRALLHEFTSHQLPLERLYTQAHQCPGLSPWGLSSRREHWVQLAWTSAEAWDSQTFLHLEACQEHSLVQHHVCWASKGFGRDGDIVKRVRRDLGSGCPHLRGLAWHFPSARR